MPRNGSGSFGLVSGNPVVPSTVISSTWANNTLNDIATGLTQSIANDGQTTPVANLPMATFRHTNVGNAIARNEYAAYGQVQDGQPHLLGSVAGTDTITASIAPGPAAYVAGQWFRFTAANTNATGTPTININGLGAKTLVRIDNTGLWAGAIVSGVVYEIYYDGTNFRIVNGSALGSQVYPINANNRFIDGGFDFWDLGTSVAVSASGNFTANMWFCAAGTGGSAVSQQNTLAAGSAPAGMTSPAVNAMVFQQTVGASSPPFITQHIESVSTFSGRSATLSVWLWVASGTLNVTQVSTAQFFGSTGSATVVTTTSVNWTLTTTPQKFTVRLDVPSISGKTVSGGGDYLGVAILFPQSTTFTVLTSQWKVEDCPSSAPTTGLPTAFEFDGYEITRAKIMRFLQLIVTVAGQAFATGFVSSATTAFATIPISPMRASPSASIIGAGTLTLSGSVVSSSTSLSMSNPTTALISGTISGGTAWQTCFAVSIGGTNTLAFDARI